MMVPSPAVPPLLAAQPAVPQGLAARGLGWRLAEATGVAKAADQAFLRQLFASTRSLELEALGAQSPLAQQFIAMQFTARDAAYRSSHPGAVQHIIEQAGAGVERTPIGLLWVDVTSAQIDLLDISLLPHWRGRGIGSVLLNALLVQSRALQLAVALQVRADNPARELYARLGFAQVARADLDLAMRWTPALPSTTHTAAETLHEQA